MKTVTIDEAAAQLHALAKLVLHGEPVLIEKDGKLLILHKHPFIEPLPPGALDAIYDEEYIREANLTEPRSVVSPDYDAGR